MKVFVVGTVLLLSAAFTCDAEEGKHPLETHKVVSPVLKDATYSNEYVADIHSVKFVEVRSRVKGYLMTIHIDEGEMVHQGQALFSLSTLAFEKELQKAEAAYKTALANLKALDVEMKNVRFLRSKNIVSSSELEVTKAKVDALRAEVEQAKADKEQAELNITFSRINAPFKGTINRIPKKVGSLIDEGDMLTSITDNSDIYAYFNLSEVDYLNYIEVSRKDPKSVKLKLANNTMYGHEGRIEMIESEFDRTTGNIAMRARFPNPEGLLKHGSNAKVVVTEPLVNVLFVPQKSTFEIQDKLYVYLVDQQGVLKQRNIVSKLRFPGYYVVESGLSVQDKIVYEGVENLADGDTIKPEPVELQDIMSLSSER